MSRATKETKLAFWECSSEQTLKIKEFRAKLAEIRSTIFTWDTDRDYNIVINELKEIYSTMEDGIIKIVSEADIMVKIIALMMHSRSSSSVGYTDLHKEHDKKTVALMKAATELEIDLDRNLDSSEFRSFIRYGRETDENLEYYLSVANKYAKLINIVIDNKFLYYLNPLKMAGVTFPEDIKEAGDRIAELMIIDSEGEVYGIYPVDFSILGDNPFAE